MAILYNYNKNGWPTCARAREDLSRRGVEYENRVVEQAPVDREALGGW